MVDLIEGEGQNLIPADVSRTKAQHPPAQETVPSTSDRTLINSACVACRSKHLKCDGLQVCSRCCSQQISCVYLKSRRGYRRSASRGKHHDNDSMPHHSQRTSTYNTLDHQTSLSALSPPVSNSLSFAGLGSMLVSVGSQLSDNGVTESRNVLRSIDAFYQRFHESHPFLPPRQHLLQVLKLRPMPHLLSAISYIASRYITIGSTARYALELESLLVSHPAREPSVVQALLLYALGSDGAGEQTKAVEILLKAQSLALELGMNSRDYAVAHGEGSFIFEESLRRTWHELNIVCVMVAGFHGQRPFYRQDLDYFVPLPCETQDFENGSIPQLRTLADFDEECFVAEEVEWSSYTYRIAAIRNLDRIMQATHSYSSSPASIDGLEAYLTNWKLHLPESKRTFHDVGGAFDEMLFQAHMITEVSAILLHRRHSRLEALAIQHITACSDSTGISGHEDHIHTIKTAQAATGVSRLVALPTPLNRHTHFFVCALTLSSIIHLSMWSSLPFLSPEQDLKERIRLNAGALKAIATVWPSALMGYSQVTQAGRMIYAARKDVAGDAFWADLMEEDITAGLIEDDPLSGQFTAPDISAST